MHRAQLVDHLLEKMSEAGDAHTSKQERKFLLTQADAIGRKATSILRGLEAVSKLPNLLKLASESVDSTETPRTVDAESELSVTDELSDGTIERCME